ncbi:hypothetical protein [Streptomyces sp. NRRL F-5123]|uniref:hypothetical protein n=1 Tax=Streptomyces sp. NRRL F-5123 TaxID=1463856 RepID=UPI0004E121B7|nr:hypothetical protein [Streptomyces sp. NRRL F-5123]
MASPRPYVVAAAGAVLAALYFVPTASASTEHAPAAAPAAHAAAADVQKADEDGGLADTGAFNTRPYLIGGAVFLVVGAGLLVESTRRARQAEEPEPDTTP